MNSPARRGSLQRLLLRNLLWPLIPILVLGATLSYVLAKDAAVTAYDASIFDDAQDLALEIHVRDGHLILELPPAAVRMLAYFNEDPVAYAVWDHDNHFIAGDELLYRSLLSHTREKFRDIKLAGKLYRSVTLDDEREGRSFSVAVAQEIKSRSNLVHRIFISMLMLGGCLLLFAIGIVVNAVHIGLRPVERLRHAIAQRHSSDLRAIDAAGTPLELLPIVHGTNELLQRLAGSLESYRRFVADAAHQLRTPLAALSSQLELNLAHPPHDVSALLAQLLDTTRRTSHLASQLLSMARLEHTEKEALDRRDFDFRQLLQEIAAVFVTSAALKSVEFDFVVKVDNFFGNALLLRELLSNLFDNAVRYAPPHSVIHMSLLQTDGGMQLQIADAGPGVPAHELSKLGTPFHQLASSAPHGCGLGLAIVREIAHLHGGEITFANGADNIGLIATVTLPVQRGNDRKNFL